MPNPLPAGVELRCPSTGEPLQQAGRELVTPDESRRYPVVDGVPILLDGATGTFRPSDYLAPVEPQPRSPAERVRGFALKVAAWQPPVSRNVGSRENYERMVGLLIADRRSGRRGPADGDPSPDLPPRVLVIGGKRLGAGSEALLESARLETVETDVVIGPRTQVVCDAMRLPFPDASFDGAVAQAVFECVPDPHQAVAELHRVLRPSGVLYSEVGFIQQVHDAAHDYWRFTDQGHRRLLRCFDEIDTGVQCGPGMALAWTVRGFAQSLAGSSRPLRLGLGRLAALLSSWLPLVDPWLVDRGAARDTASGLYFLGRRAERVPSDRDLVVRYAGAQRDPYPGSPDGAAAATAGAVDRGRVEGGTRGSSSR